MKARAVGEWSLVSLAFAFAAGARYLLVQPPTFAHACDAGGESPWCAVRMAVIATFSTYGLGYASALVAAAALVTAHRGVALLACIVGAAALVLYCYEPGAIAFVIGALMVARAQSGRPPLGLRQLAGIAFGRHQGAGREREQQG